VLLLGMIVFSSCVSTVTSKMSEVRQLHADHTYQDQLLRTFFRENKVSRELSSHVWAYTRNHTRRSRSRVHEADSELLKVLPTLMKTQLHIEVYAQVLLEQTFFLVLANSSIRAIQFVCDAAMAHRSLRAGHQVFLVGEPATSMSFVLSGTLGYMWTTRQSWSLPSVFSKDVDGPRVPLSAGDSICELALWVDWTHDGTLLAESATDLYEIDATVFKGGVLRGRNNGDLTQVWKCATRRYVFRFLQEMNDVLKDGMLNDLFVSRRACLGARRELDIDMQEGPWSSVSCFIFGQGLRSRRTAQVLSRTLSTL